MNNKTYAKIFLSFNILMALLLQLAIFCISEDPYAIKASSILIYSVLIIAYLIVLDKSISKVKVYGKKSKLIDKIILIIPFALLPLSIILTDVISILILLFIIFIFGYLPIHVFNKLYALKENIISTIDYIPLICTLILMAISLLGFIINNDHWSVFTNANNLINCIIPLVFTNIYSLMLVSKKKR